MNYLSKITISILLFLIANATIAIPHLAPPNSEADTLTPAELEQKIIALTEKVKNENRLVDLLTPENTISLPVGIAKNIGGIELIVVLDEMKFGTNGAVANAYMTLQFPGSSRNISFKAIDVSFFPWGFLEAKMQLVTNKPFDIGNLKLTLNPEDTYVVFDCMGYKKTSLSAFIEFPESSIVKEDPTTRNIIQGQQVKSEFTTEFTDFNDVLIEVNIDPFQIKGMEGFGFYAQQAIIDLSDLRNPTFGEYTNNYIKDILPGEDASLWRGVYIKQFEVKLPKDFNKNSQASTGIGAEDMLFDDIGFTGSIYASNLLDLEHGNIAGWQFSVDKLEVSLTANNFDKFGFEGKIVLPVSKNPSPMTYKAIFDDNSNYLFAVSPPDKTSFDLWAAEAEIYKNSIVSIGKKNGKFNARAELNGKLTIGLSGENAVQLADISFQKMVIQSEAPNFDIMAFSANVGTMSGFPIQVKNIGYKKQNNNHGINLTVAVSLMKADDNGFSAEGAFTIYGKQDPNEGLSSWTFSHLEFNRFAIDIKQSFYDFRGELEIFKQDPIYGNGIKGMLQAKFKPGPGLTALVQFGSVNDYRYWYADAFVTFQNGIPIFPGVDIVGFGGGAYYHMKQEYNSVATLPQEPIAKFDTTSMGGVSLSGVKYIPNNNIGIGLKASAMLGASGNIKAFNAKATFAMEFLASGGLSSISFMGEALFMSEPGTPKTQAKIYAGLFLEYDAVNKSFWGELESYINIGDALKGIGENGRAGLGQLYFGEGEWYIYLGQPTDRMGVKIMNMIQAEAYFCTGTFVPGIPPPPPEVSKILGDIDLDMCRDLNKLDNAGGFAFGARLSVSTGRRQFLIFYGSFDAGVGFDLMLVNYGDGVHCEGRSEPLGVNGWYASGQMYAYFQGEIGMHIKMFMVNKDIKILEIGAAAVLQAQLPNPLFMRGAVGGYYNVLGGLVKGRCTFEVEIGEQCEIVGADVLAGIEAIADITPQEGSADVDVFSTPQVTFNFEIDKEFEMVDFDDNIRKYRIKFVHFNLENNGNNIIGKYLWNAEKTALAFESHDILPPKIEILAEIKVQFEENINGTWQTVMVDGNAAEETKTTKFMTGEAPNYIPLSNIEYCYPIIDQLNFYKSEHPTGYIQLERGQSYLFDFPSDERWVTDARLESLGHIAQTEFIYDATNKKIEFNIPTSLIPETVYEFKLVNIPLNDNAAVDDNIANQETILESGDTLTTRKIDGSVRQSIDEETMLAYDIRTSKYDSFSAKINSLNMLSEVTYQYVTGISHMVKHFNATELFSSIEINGNTMTEPLVQCSFVTENNYWYNKYIYNLVYKGYPGYGVTLDRPVEPKGVPPLKTIEIYQTNNDFKLTEQVKTTGIVNWMSNSKLFWQRTSYEMYLDYLTLASKASMSDYNSNQRLYNLIFTPFHSEVVNKYYEFDIQYILPGLKTITTSKRLSIFHQ